MHPTFETIFARLEDFDIAITGSALKDYEAAGDIDVLFPASQDFKQLAIELGVPYRGGFEGDGGRVHSLKIVLPGIDKVLNLIQRADVERFDQWPHMVLLRNGTTLQDGVFHDKTAVVEDEAEPEEDFSNRPDTEPLCCWCGGPLVLDEHNIGWCQDSKPCQERQLRCAITQEVEPEEDEDGNPIGTPTLKYLFVPTPRQTEIMESTAPNLFAWGNRGGGKSHAIRWMMHALASAIPGFKYAILRTSYPELAKNHLVFLEDEMKSLGGEENGFRYNKTDHIAYYPEGAIGFYAQCDTDADVKKVLGAEVVCVVFDEAPTFDWNHMRLIAGSVRAKRGLGLKVRTIYLGNPIGDSIDKLWQYFMDKDVSVKDDPEYRPQDWEAIEIRIQDNPHLDAKEYWRQFSGLAPNVIKAWREGVRVEERTMFEFLPTRKGQPYHVVNEVPRLGDGTPLFTVDTKGVYHFPDWVHIYRAYDHGFDPDPAVCLWFAVYGRRVLCFKERAWHRTLVKDIATDIKAESAGMRVVNTYCDRSIDVDNGADIRTILGKFEDAGVPMEPTVNNREYFADAIHTALGTKVDGNLPQFQFYQRGCPNTVKYLPRMKYDERNPAKMADHKQDHYAVCVAYFGMSRFPITSPDKTGTVKRMLLAKMSPGSSMARVFERKLRREERRG